MKREVSELVQWFRYKTPEEAAAWLIADLTGYPIRHRHKEEDIAYLANALVAWAKSRVLT